MKSVSPLDLQDWDAPDDWGDNYAERRWRIGLIHVRIGIGPQHVVPAMAVVVHEAGKRAIADGKDQQLRDALAKI